MRAPAITQNACEHSLCFESEYFMRSKPNNPEIEKSTLSFSLITTFLVTLPHVNHVPWTIFVFFILALGWRLSSNSTKLSLPGRGLLFLISVASVSLIFMEHKTLIGLQAGTSFFIVALGLKLLELKRVRDLYLVIFLSFFVATTQFLYTQTLLMGLYVLVVTGLLIVSLISLNAANAINLVSQFKLSALLIYQAFPIMVLLFLIFPRIATPKFGLVAQDGIAITGLSDTLNPGQISQLSQSAEVAFRVNFEGKVPPRKERYWRGPVFWHTDGQQWTMAEPTPLAQNQIQVSGNTYRYTVTLEPHRQKWLFALDTPTEKPFGASQTSDLLLVTAKPITKRRSYTLSSNTQYNTGMLSNRDRRMGLQLPKPPSHQITNLVKSWRQNNPNPAAIVRQAFNYFHDQEFFYTLSPPLYETDPIESFLFELRRGFCEHYATAFVYLMRAANIPARVVTGYQGGEFNTVGKFLEIRQADAHAWAEIWLRGKGWVRLDPTSAVAPERIEKGIDLLVQLATGEISFGSLERSGLSTLIQNIHYAWAAAEHAWHRRIIAYNANLQNNLLSRWNIKNLANRMVALVGGIALLLLLISLLVLNNRTMRKDKTIALYQRFCKKLAKRGITRTNTEGAGDFAKRAAVALPNLDLKIDEVTQSYQNLRYARETNAEGLKHFSHLVRAFRV